MESVLKKSVVLIGMMGSGKSSVGRLLANDLAVPFWDVDTEIEVSANRKISEIFEEYGEAEFRSLESRVLKRLLGEKPSVIATGGGAFVNSQNREAILNNCISVWLDAELDTLWDRVRTKTHRPLLQAENPKQVLANLMKNRNPTYGLADFRVKSYPEQAHQEMVDRIRQTIGF